MKPFRRRLLQAGLVSVAAPTLHSAHAAAPEPQGAAAPAAGAATGADLRATTPDSSWTDWKGGPAPSLDLPDLEGHTRSLDEFLGMVVIVNFWATWCEPSQVEIPALSALADQHADDGLRLLAVNNGESREKIDAFLDKLQIQGLVLRDGDGVAAHNWNVTGTPADFVIDRDGKIRYWRLNALDWTKSAVINPVIALL